MISLEPRRSAAVIGFVLTGTLLSGTPVATAATTPTTYRPAHSVHFDAGTYTGFAFNASGGIVATRTATLPRSSSAPTTLRTAIPTHPGSWIFITKGIWAGFYVRESNRTYLPFTRQRLVAFAAGTHTGYRFSASGAVIAHKTSTLPQASSAHTSAQAVIGTSTSYLLVVDGVWAGYWVPIGAGVGLRYPPLGAGRLSLSRVVTGLDQPLYATNADDNSGRLFVVERTGRVRVVKNGALQAGAFLDLTAKVSCCVGERGLLGLAFHPSFASNLRLFADYTDSTGDIIVAEYTANAARTSASAASERVILRINHRTYANHNGGWIGFGPDGYLYIGTGDGGGAGDPLNNAQNKNSLLGKMLRIDVNGAQPYAIPPTNPFASSGGAKAVWAWGLRNPWRDGFDRERGDLYIGDVGQDQFEEIDRSSRGFGGQNYGWNVMEGFRCYNATTCSTVGKALPVAAYAHGSADSVGCAVTGGYVYRGTLQPALQGNYILGDYCTGRIWTMYQDENVANLVSQGQFGVNISSFGEGENGEIYLTDLGGALYRVLVKP